jgi:hypothetical protein
MARRRGLLRTVGRTAAITGTATAVSGRVARRQQQKFASQDKRAAPPESASSADVVGSLQRLADLRASGALSEKEFSAAKAKLLSS